MPISHRGFCVVSTLRAQNPHRVLSCECVSVAPHRLGIKRLSVTGSMQLPICDAWRCHHVGSCLLQIQVSEFVSEKLARWRWWVTNAGLAPEAWGPTFCWCFQVWRSDTDWAMKSSMRKCCLRTTSHQEISLWLSTSPQSVYSQRHTGLVRDTSSEALVSLRHKFQMEWKTSNQPARLRTGRQSSPVCRAVCKNVLQSKWGHANLQDFDFRTHICSHQKLGTSLHDSEHAIEEEKDPGDYLNAYEHTDFCIADLFVTHSESQMKQVQNTTICLGSILSSAIFSVTFFRHPSQFFPVTGSCKNVRRE